MESVFPMRSKGKIMRKNPGMSSLNKLLRTIKSREERDRILWGAICVLKATKKAYTLKRCVANNLYKLVKESQPACPPATAPPPPPAAPLPPPPAAPLPPQPAPSPRHSPPHQPAPSPRHSPPPPPPLRSPPPPLSPLGAPSPSYSLLQSPSDSASASPLVAMPQNASQVPPVLRRSVRIAMMIPNAPIIIESTRLRTRKREAPSTGEVRDTAEMHDTTEMREPPTMDGVPVPPPNDRETLTHHIESYLGSVEGLATRFTYKILGHLLESPIDEITYNSLNDDSQYREVRDIFPSAMGHVICPPFRVVAAEEQGIVYLDYDSRLGISSHHLDEAYDIMEQNPDAHASKRIKGPRSR